MSEQNGNEKTIDPAALAERIETILNAKNAKDIERLSVEGKTVLADFFVVASARSTTQIKALAEEIEYKLKTDLGLLPHHLEGVDSKRWILLDYGDVVVHLFLEEERTYYNLEKLWSARRQERERAGAEPGGDDLPAGGDADGEVSAEGGDTSAGN